MLQNAAEEKTRVSDENNDEIKHEPCGNCMYAQMADGKTRIRSIARTYRVVASNYPTTAEYRPVNREMTANDKALRRPLAVIVTHIHAVAP